MFNAAKSGLFKPRRGKHQPVVEYRRGDEPFALAVHRPEALAVLQVENLDDVAGNAY
jgi:hypothetical protein